VFALRNVTTVIALTPQQLGWLDELQTHMSGFLYCGLSLAPSHSRGDNLIGSCWAVSCSYFVSPASLSILVRGSANPVARERRLHSWRSRRYRAVAGVEPNFVQSQTEQSGILDRSVRNRLTSDIYINEALVSAKITRERSTPI
jgi:hypothetical protein